MDTINLTKKINVRRFSIKLKLIFIFGALILLSILVLGAFAIGLARKATTKKVETHLKDKAYDVAEVIDGRIKALYQFLRGIARSPILRDKDISYEEKARYCKDEASAIAIIKFLAIANKDALLYTHGQKTIKVDHLEYYGVTMQGKDFISEPFISNINFITFNT